MSIIEIANFSKEEKDAYEESLKHYRDIKNVVDSSKEEGRLEGIEQGIDENVKNGIQKGYSNEIISDITGRSIEVIQRIREEMSRN